LKKLNGEAPVKRTWIIVTALILIGLVSLFSHNIVFAKQKPEPSFAKNLQVLTFLKSKKELKSWMDMIKQSLGVNCSYCHNTQNFASDAKVPKRRARMMLKMLVQIRQEYFSFPDAKKPTCYTCHQGHKVPVNMPPGGFKNFSDN
jgi:hypothetical protein